MHAARQLMACGLLSRATTAWSQMETVPDSESGFGSVRQEDSPELSPKALSELDDENKIMAGEPALNTPWTFWFDRAPKGTNAQDYFANLKKICTVNTIKAFWCVYNNLRSADQLKNGESYHLMRGLDRRPVWEDSNNVEGGRWTFRCGRDYTGAAWLELLLAAVGEGFLDHVAEGDDVVGISIKIRGSESTVFQIWNQTVLARDQSKVMAKVREVLQAIDVVLNREKYESNREHLVQTVMKSKYHKSSPVSPMAPQGHKSSPVSPMAPQGRFTSLFQPQSPMSPPPFRAQVPPQQQEPGCEVFQLHMPLLPEVPGPLSPPPAPARSTPGTLHLLEPHPPTSPTVGATPSSPQEQPLLPPPPQPAAVGGVLVEAPSNVHSGVSHPQAPPLPGFSHSHPGSTAVRSPRMAAVPRPLFPPPVFQAPPPLEGFRYRYPPPPVQRYPGY